MREETEQKLNTEEMDSRLFEFGKEGGKKRETQCTE